MIIFKFLSSQLKKQKINIGLLIILNLLAWIIGITTTYCTGTYIDILMINPVIEDIYLYTMIILGLSVFSTLLNAYLNNVFTLVNANIAFDVNAKLLRHVKRLPLQFFKDKNPVYLNQRINADCNKIIKFAMEILIKISTQLICFVIVLIILANKSIKMCFFMLCSIPLYLLLYKMFKQKVYISNLKYIEEQNNFFANMNKQLFHSRFIKINSLFRKLDEQLEDAYPKYLKALLDYFRCSYMLGSIGGILEAIFNVFLYLYGGIEILNKRMTVGDFIIIKSYYLVLLKTLTTIFATIRTYPEALVAYNRLNEILNIKKEPNGSKMLQRIDNIKIKDVNLTINGKQILNNIHCSFQRGNIYLLKGHNGAGKSSLINVLLGLYMNEYTGNIQYNGIDIRELDMYKIRRKLVGVVDQEPLLMCSTIREEMEYQVDSFNENQLEKLLKEFNLKEVDCITSQDKNHEMNISGGEKQKISIIKSMLKNADIVIMDEPNSALDTKSINTLVEILQKNKNSMITIIISHDNVFDSIADQTIQI